MSKVRWLSLGVRLEDDQFQLILKDKEINTSKLYKDYYNKVLLEEERKLLLVKIMHELESCSIKTFHQQLKEIELILWEYSKFYNIQGELGIYVSEIIDGTPCIKDDSLMAIGLVSILPEQLDQMDKGFWDQMDRNEIEFEDYLEELQEIYMNYFPNLEIGKEGEFHDYLNKDISLDVELIGNLKYFSFYHGTMHDYRKSKEQLGVFGIFRLVQNGQDILNCQSILMTINGYMSKILKECQKVDLKIYPEVWIFEYDELMEFPKKI